MKYHRKNNLRLRNTSLDVYLSKIQIYSKCSKDFFYVFSSNCIGKSKFYVFTENLKIYQHLENNLIQCIQLYNCLTKLLRVFRVGKFSIEFEEDTFSLLE